MKSLLTSLAIAIGCSLSASAQPAAPLVYELACPAGYSPLGPSGKTFNSVTKKWRANVCVSDAGDGTMVCQMSGCRGNVTGTGGAGRVTLWSGASSVVASDEFVWVDDTGSSSFNVTIGDPANESGVLDICDTSLSECHHVPVVSQAATVGAVCFYDANFTFIPSLRCDPGIIDDNSGDLTGTGGSFFGSYFTNTNCAAVGSAANPSVAACGAAAAGAFSCSTAASTGTCTVTATRVNTSSRIIVQQSTAESANLGVTCNTTLVTPTTKPLLASKTNSTGFTINLGTVTTNPACFVYWIVN